MVGQSLWKNLKVLVSIDKQIEDLKEKIDQTKKLLTNDQINIPKLEASIEKYKQSYLNEKKSIALLELNAKDLNDRENTKKMALDKITNPKEYKALEKEIKAISSQRIEQDDLMIKAWHQIEASEKKLEQEKADKENQIIQLKEGIVAQEEALNDLNKNLDELLKEKINASNNIPADWLEKYESMRHRVSDPIVPVLGLSCSACFYSILRQDLCTLKKSGVLPCRNCYRFLYYDEEEEKELKKETF